MPDSGSVGGDIRTGAGGAGSKPWGEASCPGGSIAAIFPPRADRVVAYRLRSNPTVTEQDILEGYQAATVDRCRPAGGVLLGVQDETHDLDAWLAQQPPCGSWKPRAPLHWRLLSTEGEATAHWARQLKYWYEQRGSMEEFFRILKTGTRIKDRRLDAAADLRKCLALDAITAWRVFGRQRAARDTPEQSATDWLSDDAIQTARVLLDPHGIRTGQWSPDEPLTLATCGADLARLVGFHPSIRPPRPYQLIHQGRLPRIRGVLEPNRAAANSSIMETADSSAKATELRIPSLEEWLTARAKGRPHGICVPVRQIPGPQGLIGATCP